MQKEEDQKFLENKLNIDIDINSESLIVTINNKINLTSIKVGNKLIKFLEETELPLKEDELKEIFKEKSNEFKGLMKEAVLERSNILKINLKDINFDEASLEFKKSLDKITNEVIINQLTKEVLALYQFKTNEEKEKLINIIITDYARRISELINLEESFRIKSLKNNFEAAYKKMEDIERIRNNVKL